MDIERLRERLLHGQVIPACPLALKNDGQWSEPHQTALTRYYHDAGAGGIAVGVHSTQFAIRDPKFGLYEPVLELVSNRLAELEASSERKMVKIAGICGDTRQAIAEAEISIGLGYHAGLVSLTAFNRRTESEALAHCKAVAESIPFFGFYLQPAVGGRVFSHQFWYELCELPNLVAIKVAPFNRYQTLDVIRAVLLAGRDDVALYTGNDDNIIADLVTPFSFHVGHHLQTRSFDGGLLGQWGVWTRRAVETLDAIEADRTDPKEIKKWLQVNTAMTDANAAIFDAANQFRGCIPGILEVLRRVGLVESCRCLDPDEVLSPGQLEEIDRVSMAYPQLTDDEFVRENLDRWLA